MCWNTVTAYAASNGPSPGMLAPSDARYVPGPPALAAPQAVLDLSQGGKHFRRQLNGNERVHCWHIRPFADVLFPSPGVGRG